MLNENEELAAIRGRYARGESQTADIGILFVLFDDLQQTLDDALAALLRDNEALTKAEEQVAQLHEAAEQALHYLLLPVGPEGYGDAGPYASLLQKALAAITKPEEA